jgi:hypothetical protein
MLLAELMCKDNNKNLDRSRRVWQLKHTVSQTITQVDTQAPVIGTAGADATIECTATPSFTAPTASDACNTVTVQQIGPDVYWWKQLC